MKQNLSENAIRLGKHPKNPDDKPKPAAQEQNDLLRSAKNLKGKKAAIGTSYSFTWT